MTFAMHQCFQYIFILEQTFIVPQFLCVLFCSLFIHVASLMQLICILPSQAIFSLTVSMKGTDKSGGKEAETAKIFFGFVIK